MRAETLVAGLMLFAIIAYGVFAGADFGGGVWDFFAFGPRKRAQRDAIARAMAPVWETNHVWLIFAIVLLFTGFPRAFAALSIGLFAPFHLALLGITLRGAAFVFRAYGPKTTDATRPWGAVFGAASTVTPMVLGTSMGAVSVGTMHVDGDVVQVSALPPWLQPLALVMGALALALCAYLAAVFLLCETTGELREDFRRRALASGTVVVGLSIIAIPVALANAPHFGERLASGQTLAVVAAGAVAAFASGSSLLARKYALARVAAAAQIALLLAGFGVAQYPYIVYPDLTIHDAAAPEATLRFLLWSAIPGALLLGPSLWLLLRVFKTRTEAARAAPR
jgi:cytochrome d ubiquinol oxidase subunit II